MTPVVAMLVSCATVNQAGVGEPAYDAAVGDSGVLVGDSVDSAVDSAIDTADSGPPPMDADGDGYDEESDCNDADSTIHPGAADACDSVDQDCDGVPYATAACAEPTPWGEVSDFLVAPGYLYMVDDMTGDGIADAFEIDRDWRFYPGEAEFPSAPWGPPEGARNTFLLEMCPEHGPDNVGDLDGDGTNDFVIADTQCARHLYVHLGPLPDVGVWKGMSDSEEVWTAPVPEEAWFNARAWGGDFNGDGRADYVGSEGAQERDGTVAAFDVFFGGMWGETQVRTLTSGKWSARILDVLDDMDGDGLDEVHAYMSYSGVGPRHPIFSGGDLAGADGFDVADFQLAALVPATDERPGDGDYLVDIRVVSAGDWTGDGTSDLVTVFSQWTDADIQTGGVFLFDGAARGDFNISDAVGSWIGNDREYGELNPNFKVLDADGDGQLEILVSEQHVDKWYLVPHILPTLNTPLYGLTFSGSIYPLGEPLDINGDGFDDLSFNDIDNARGALWLGWPIPFDDPSAW